MQITTRAVNRRKNDYKNADEAKLLDTIELTAVLGACCGVEHFLPLVGQFVTSFHPQDHYYIEQHISTIHRLTSSIAHLPNLDLTRKDSQQTVHEFHDQGLLLSLRRTVYIQLPFL